MRGMQDIEVFVRTAECGNVSAAARELGLSPAVASLAIKRLEDELQTILCIRSTRSLRLTQAGTVFLTHARRLLDTYQQARKALHTENQTQRENIHLSLPSDFGRNLALSWLDQFQADHPHVHFRLSVSDRVTDLYRESVDIAIRFGQPPDSNLVALPLAPTCRRVLCAAPTYLAQHPAPTHPEQLVYHNCLCFRVGERHHHRWHFWRDGQCHVQTVQGNRCADDADIVRRWGIAGHGILYKSQLDITPDLQAGRLIALCQDWQGEPAPLYMLCADRRQLSPTTRALREFLQAQCATLLR